MAHGSLKSEETRRLNIHVSPEMHYKLKNLAAKKYVSIRKIVNRAIVKYVNNDEKYD